MRVTRFASVIVLAAAALAAAGCARVEGRTAWEEAIHTQTVPPMKAPADAVYPVPPPPFTPGIFPCSRCHEGGEAVKDEQPAIPHELHAGRGLECTDCHSPEDADAAPHRPSRTTCDQCHADRATLSKGAATYFARITTDPGTMGEQTRFPSRWKSRDVEPQHVRHAKADVACAACHGEVSDGPFTKPKAVALMAKCVACHEARGKPVTCETCHRETTGKPHANVVLHHAEEQRGCLDCHDPADRDLLRLANGTKIPFDESFKLCGQCHGTQFRDWKVGLHGKRTGEWNGRREYRLCVACHWPHEPRFAPMAPMPRPARPDEVR
jgi:Zn finger protein HypA/HybF involved in hydrogenase expression